jgi:hypothetical protein
VTAHSLKAIGIGDKGGEDGTYAEKRLREAPFPNEFAAPPEPAGILCEMPEIAKSPCKFAEI